MNYASQTNRAVFELSKFKVQFCETYQTYLLNNKWANTYSESYFHEQSDLVKSLLCQQLKNGLNHKEYLQNLLDNLENRIDSLDKNKSNSPDFFENYSIKIAYTNIHQQEPHSNQSKYERYLNNQLEPDASEIEFFSFLTFHEKKLNGYKNILDFEKGLLLYTIMLYRDAITNLDDYINSIFMNVEFTDFKNYDFEDFHSLKPQQKNNMVCNFNLDKISVAHLFSILINEDIIMFDELNYAKNNTKMKRFVEQNFTFLNFRKERIAIKTFNREYSEATCVGSAAVKQHKAFIDKLILILQTRKTNMKD